MPIEESLISKLEEALSSGENICYFGIDLITEDYNPQKLSELARDKGLEQRLGYLAEICAQAAKVTHIPEERKLTDLYKALEGCFMEWQYLVPNYGWNSKVIRARMERGVLDKVIREKWKIYSALEPDEIEDWIDLYVTRDFLHFTPLERYDMSQKGIKYTRILR